MLDHHSRGRDTTPQLEASQKERCGAQQTIQLRLLVGGHHQILDQEGDLERGEADESLEPC